MKIYTVTVFESYAWDDDENHEIKMVKTFPTKTQAENWIEKQKEVKMDRTIHYDIWEDVLSTQKISDDNGMTWIWDEEEQRLYCQEAEEELIESGSLEDLEQNGYFDVFSWEEALAILKRDAYIIKKKGK